MERDEGRKEGMAKLISSDDDEAARPPLASACVRVRTRNATPKTRGAILGVARYLSITEVGSQKSLVNKVAFRIKSILEKDG